jgi:hypothetical protein
VPTLADVLEARRRILRHLRPTPLFGYAGLDELLGAEVLAQHAPGRPDARKRPTKRLQLHRLWRSLPFMLPSAGSGARKCSQPASIRTFHRWLRVRRLSWPGVCQGQA